MQLRLNYMLKFYSFEKKNSDSFSTKDSTGNGCDGI